MASIKLRADWDAVRTRRAAKVAGDSDQVRRLLAIAAVYEGMSREDAARLGGMDRQTLRDWVHRFNDEGPEGLVNRPAPGNERRLTAAQEAELAQWVEGGPVSAGLGHLARWRCADLQGLILERWGVDYHERTIGQKTQRTRIWARKGTRPRQVTDLRTACVYLFGAICPERQTGAAVVMQRADTQGMQHHLDEISANVAPGAHAVLVLDQAGWHTTAKLKTPDNITFLPLPPRSPELNPAENVWEYLRGRWLSNHVFADYDAILDAVCDAWNRLIAEPARIASIGSRDWAISGQS